MHHFEEGQKRASPQIIPPHGGYRDLQSYQMSEMVYGGTVSFCDGLISKRVRTHEDHSGCAERHVLLWGATGRMWGNGVNDQGMQGLSGFIE